MTTPDSSSQSPNRIATTRTVAPGQISMIAPKIPVITAMVVIALENTRLTSTVCTCGSSHSCSY